jgi:hypothetical protein
MQLYLVDTESTPPYPRGSGRVFQRSQVFSEIGIQDPYINLPRGAASSQLSHLRRRTGAHKIWVLNKHAISWMILTAIRQLEAHLWQSVVQSHGEVQRIFRLYRNHNPCSDDLEPARRGARRRAARTPGRARPLYELTTPRRSASPPRWARSRR